MANINDAASFVSQMWSELLVDRIADEAAIQQLWRNERECQWHEDWTRVVIDGESFDAKNATVVLLGDRAGDKYGDAWFEAQGSKVVTRSVPDLAAQDELRALLEKWREADKDAMADAVAFYNGDGCGCCSGGDIFDVITTSVTETVERRARVEDCTFFAAVSIGTMISIPKIADIEPYTAACEQSAPSISEIEITTSAYSAIEVDERPD